MAVTEWDVEGRRVRLWHSSWTGRARIAVDGRVIFSRPWVWSDSRFAHSFHIGQTDCRLRVTSSRFGYRYELLVGAEPANVVAPRRRWRIPVSLRLFLAILLLVGISTGSFVLVRAHRQYVAFQKIKEFHANVGMEQHGPPWLRRRVGDHWIFLFSDVVDVDLGGTQVGNDDLSELANFPQLERLSLEGALFTTDMGMVHLRELTNLRELNLGRTQVSDAGLVDLKPLKKLEELYLDGTKVTDAGLANLAELTSLQYVALDETSITDRGLVSLAGLPNLCGIGLADTQITGAGIALLKSLPNLAILDFGGAPITDEGARNLSALTSLEKLCLHNTRITDQALASLAGLTNLQRLDVDGTQVTDDGVAQLKRALPELKVNK